MKSRTGYHGESVGIEVSAELEALLKNADRLEYNNEQANTRRHFSLDMAQEDEGMHLPTPNRSGFGLYRPTAIRGGSAAGCTASAGFGRVLEGMSISDIAQRESVYQPAINATVENHLKKLKEVLSDLYLALCRDLQVEVDKSPS
jgi:hypothetical protein